MRAVHSLVLSIAVILNAIDWTSQFDYLPNGDPIPYVNRSGPSIYPDRHQSRERNFFCPSRPYFQDSLPSPGEPSFRARSRSPNTLPLRSESSSLPAGFKLDQVKYIRLIPNSNPNLRFEIKNYTIPGDKEILLRGRKQIFEPILTKERLVLSTSTGDVLGIFEKKNKLLRGIYTLKYPKTSYATPQRVKINMHSGAIQEMTLEEMQAVPIGSPHPVSKNFRTVIYDGSRTNK
ncbi:uncharacterized protein LOC117180551 [Belonocnema kinseyi]|uniref:uncharacterized protein LOC117180551 n=1 Tax=Belonocnema kinseyi TaxID=2817044 RepID=UPI00143DAAA7|nr:uncharacterized protein LOC117180551 [Belonocnema kinseyi]